jgi:hypothetical protein
MDGLRVLSEEMVTQGEIESLIGQRNQVRRVKRIYDRQAASVLERLLAGAVIEPGTHTVEVETRIDGPRRVTRLAVG